MKKGMEDMGNKKLCIIFGTRPEIIKLSSLIKLCRKKKIPFFTIHTGQHYSYYMDEIFFEDLKLPAPDYKLRIRSKAPYRQGDHTGRMMIGIENILLKEMPYCVIVQGDTNTALAGALTAEKISTTKGYTGYEIKVAHVEAGLRSYDRSMPEEINRFLVDHLSDFLFVPTRLEKEIALKEGVPAANIHITGNTIVDAVINNLKLSGQRRSVLDRYGLKKNDYILLTLHRQESVDSSERLASIMKGVARVSDALGAPVLFPVHPRTANKILKFGIKVEKSIKTIDPVDFLDFLHLESNAFLILTDSGGVQEESCILKVPCVTLRDNTERPETVKSGSNIVSGTSPEKILSSALKMAKKDRDWLNPFGNGHAAEMILKILMRG